MAEENIANEQLKPKKKKKKHTGLIIFLILITLLIGLPVGFYYGFIHDLGHKEITSTEGFTIDDVMNNAVDKCLDNVAETKAVTIGITDTDMNNLLQNAAKDLLESKFVRGLYIETKNGFINFVLELDGVKNVFGTRVILSTKLEEVKLTIDGEEDNYFSFSIKKIGIGRLSGVEYVAMSLVNKLITDKTVNDALKGVINAQSDLKNNRILYKKSDFVKDLQGFIDGGAEGFSFKNMLQVFLENDLIHIDINGGLTFVADCEPLTQNPEYVDVYDLHLDDASKHGGLDLEKVRADLEKILTANPDKVGNENDIYFFLARGYNKCTEAEKAIIDSLDLSCMGASFDAHSYQGFALTGDSIADICAHQISDNMMGKTPSDFMTTDGFTMIDCKELDIVSYMKTTRLIGRNMILSRFDADGNAKVSYITLDNMYANIYKGKTEFVAGFNLNGLETTFILDTVVNEEKSVADFAAGKFELAYTMNTLMYGGVVASLDFSHGFYEMLEGGFNALDGVKIESNADKSQYYLIFDFSQSVMGNVTTELQPVLSQCDYAFETTGTKPEDYGSIILKGKYHA